MKRFVLLIAALFCASAFADELPKIAVYVNSSMLPSENRTLETSVMSTLLRSGKYKVVDRSQASSGSLASEHIKQRDGSVNNEQIKKLGTQLGVDFICIPDITNAFGKWNFSIRIIDVETAEVVAMGEESFIEMSMDKLKIALDKVLGEMLNIKITSAQGADAAGIPGQTQVRPKYDRTEIYATERFAAYGRPIAVVGPNHILTVVEEGKNYYKIRNAKGNDGFVRKKDVVDANTQYVDMNKKSAEQETAARTPPETGSEGGTLTDVFCPSKKGTILTFAGYDKNGKLTIYSRMDIMDVTGTRDNGTVVYTMQLFDKKMRPHILTKKAIDGIVYIIDGVAGASNFIPPGSKITEATPLQLPSEMAINDILPDAGFSGQAGIVKVKSSITDRKCTAVETITVPAGTFECYKVEQKITTMMNKAKVTINSIVWYARGIGEVQTILYDHKGKLMSSSALKSISVSDAVVSQDKPENKSGRLEKWCRFELGGALGWNSRVDSYSGYGSGYIPRDTSSGFITGLDLHLDLMYLELLGDFHLSLEDGYYGTGGILAKYPIGSDVIQISPVLGLGVIGSNDAVGSPYMLGGRIDIGMSGFSYLRTEFLYGGNFEDENMMSFKIGCGLDVGIARTELRYNIITGTSGEWKSTRHIVELRSGLSVRW